MSDLKISLIIPAYNEENRIATCLEHAIRNSGGKFHEIIVVDNASTDKTAEIASGIPGVMVVHEGRKGLTRARQCGFLESRGDVLAYIDADTWMPLGWVDQVESVFRRSEIACLSGPYVYYDLLPWQQYLVKLYWSLLGIPTYWLVGYMTVGGNFAIRRSVLKSMSGFDTSIEFYGEDTDIARRASRFGKVEFSLSFAMPTSGRRLIEEGFLKTGYVYVTNFLSQVFLKRSAHKDYTDIR